MTSPAPLKSWRHRRHKPWRILVPGTSPHQGFTTVMLPSAAAAMNHTLALYAGLVHSFAPRFDTKWLVCQLRPMSSLFLLDVNALTALKPERWNI